MPAPTVWFTSCHQTVFVLLAILEQLPVPIGDIRCFGHRHPVVASKVSRFSFDAALLVGLGWHTKLRFEAPMRTEGHESGCLFSP
jgi:hypothetical protein